jgi:hypothetical protein
MVRKKSRLMVILIILFCVGWTVELWSADEPTLGQESVADNEDQIQSQMVALIKAICKVSRLNPHRIYWTNVSPKLN